ncbi:MAG: 50S ribosomal protein L32e [Candidatus Methanofastidiosia archaeon]
MADERLLKLRKETSKKRPKFRRQETWKLKKFKNNPKWRKPRGHSSKMRRKLKGKPSLVSIGYRGPREVRYFHPCGLPEAFVTNVTQIDDVEGGVVRIVSSIGNKKKAEILLKAKKKKMKVVNPKIKFLYINSVESLERFAVIKENITEYRLAKVDEDIQSQILDKAEEMGIKLEMGA